MLAYRRATARHNPHHAIGQPERSDQQVTVDGSRGPRCLACLSSDILMPLARSAFGNFATLLVAREEVARYKLEVGLAS